MYGTEIERSIVGIPVQVNYQSAEAYGDEVRKASLECIRVVDTIRVAGLSDVYTWKGGFVDGCLSSDIPVGLNGVSVPGASREQYSPDTWGPRTCQVGRHRWDCMRET